MCLLFVCAMTLDEYIRDPAPAPSLSASIAHKLLTRSARHAWLAHPRLNPTWLPDEPTPESDLGTAIHAMLLEDNHSRISVVEAPDWRKRDAQLARDDARACGLVPLLVHRYQEARVVVEAAKRAITNAPEIKKAFDGGLIERTMMWDEDGYWSRCRPDLVTADYRLAIDLKTTSGSAEPEAWTRGQLLMMGYDVQGAFGLRALRMLHKPRDCSFVFMVVETEPPYAVSFIGLSPEFEAFAESKRASAFERWKFYMSTDTWPSYPSRIAWAEPPPWAVTRWDEKRLVGGGVEDL